MIKSFIDQKILSRGKDFVQLVFFNIFCSFVYWGWGFLIGDLVPFQIHDNFRQYIPIISIILNSCALFEIFSIHKAGLYLQVLIIFHAGYLLFFNQHHHVFILAFTLLLVLQSLTFKKRKELFLFYIFATILSIALTVVATYNRELFMYNSFTVILLSPIAALLKISSDEVRLLQSQKISELKVEKLNLKINEQLNILGSALAHEINTPLTTILGYTEMLDLYKHKNIPLDSKFIKKIEKQVIQIKEITDMLSSLSSDPKKNGSGGTTSEEIIIDVKNHLETKLSLNKLKLVFIYDQSYYYEIEKGKMYYIFTEILKQFPTQIEDLNIEIKFSEKDICFLIDKPNELMINDLNTMSAQLLANNYNYKIKNYESDTKLGIQLKKEDQGV